MLSFEQIFLSTRWTILLNLQAEVFRVNGYTALIKDQTLLRQLLHCIPSSLSLLYTELFSLFSTWLLFVLILTIIGFFVVWRTCCKSSSCSASSLLNRTVFYSILSGTVSYACCPCWWSWPHLERKKENHFSRGLSFLDLYVFSELETIHICLFCSWNE